jgi:hypothetical protein
LGVSWNNWVTIIFSRRALFCVISSVYVTGKVGNFLIFPTNSCTANCENFLARCKQLFHDHEMAIHGLKFLRSWQWFSYWYSLPFHRVQRFITVSQESTSWPYLNQLNPVHTFTPYIMFQFTPMYISQVVSPLQVFWLLHALFISTTSCPTISPSLIWLP